MMWNHNNHMDMPDPTIQNYQQTAHSKRWKGKGRWTAERRHARNDTRQGQVSAVNPLQMQYIYIRIYIMLYIPIPSYTILYHLLPIISS